MVKNKELKRLRKAIAKEQEKVRETSFISKQAGEKKRLERELFVLRNPKKIETASRIKRGFKILATKSFKGLKKQAKLIRDQQLREDALSRKRLKPIKKKKRRERDGFNIFAPLDI